MSIVQCTLLLSFNHRLPSSVKVIYVKRFIDLFNDMTGFAHGRRSGKLRDSFCKSGSASFSGVWTGLSWRRYRKHEERSDSMLTYRTEVKEVSVAAKRWSWIVPHKIYELVYGSRLIYV
ncbi:hypothetical protein [Halobacillus campisalis]|uniref:Uncharacterized protein n=1 Tax=Halobacillus campisalis TaxID=435909 RepID=A0ABW2K2B2_9BACI